MTTRKFSRRNFLSMAGLTAAGTLAAACAPQVVEKTVVVEKPVEKTVVVEKSIEKTVVVGATAAPKGPVTLKLQRFFGDCTDQFKGETDLAKAFGECGIFHVMTNKWNAEHPDMKIETLIVDWPGYDRLNAQFAAGDPPDISVMHGHYIPNYGSRGLLVPLEENFKAIGIDVNDFVDAARNYVEYKGKILGLPFDVNGDLWHIDVGMWKEAGLTGSDGKPTLPKSPEEFMAVGEKYVKDTGKTFIEAQMNGLNGTIWPWAGFVYQQGGSLVSSDQTKPTVNTEEGLRALEFMASWQQKGLLTPKTDYPAADQRFLQGKTSSWITGTWAVDAYDNQVKSGASALKEYMVTNVPQVFGKPGAWSASHDWVLPKPAKPDTSRLDAATQFLKFLYDNNLNWARTGHLSSRKSIIASKEYAQLPHRGEYASFSEAAKPYPRVSFISTLETMMDEEIQKVWIGDLKPKEALVEAQKRLDDFIKYAGA